jgi:hypothetical protein
MFWADLRQVKEARDNGIASDRRVIKWTDGYGTTSETKDEMQPYHSQFIEQDAFLGFDYENVLRRIYDEMLIHDDKEPSTENYNYMEYECHEDSDHSCP